MKFAKHVSRLEVRHEDEPCCREDLKCTRSKCGQPLDATVNRGALRHVTGEKCGEMEDDVISSCTDTKDVSAGGNSNTVALAYIFPQ